MPIAHRFIRMDQHTAITLLCDCLNIDTCETKAARLKQLSTSDWVETLQQSNKHGVTPLLYQRLQTAGLSPDIPADILLRLRKIYLTSTARNMRLYHELSKLLAVLQKNAIPIIVLKGAYLAEIVYGNIALRPMSDVDLLVKKQDLARSQQKLLQAGFSPRNSRLVLDLHWCIENSLTDFIDMEKIWENAQPAVVAGVEVLVLSPEDLIVHLCLHLAFHHLFRVAGLRSLCDIRETIKYYSPQIEWQQIRSRAREWGVSNVVCLPLLLARDMIGARIPDDVMEDFKPERLDLQLKTWAMEQIFHEPDDISSISPYFCQLWKPGSFREKLISFRKLLFPSPEFVSQRYPAPFGSIRNYLYYLIRLKDHVIPYIRVLWRILSRDKEMASLIKRQNRDIAMRKRLLSRSEKSELKLQVNSKQ